MKTGKPGPMRLSEKLNAELDTIREEAVASMRSQLTRFRQDLQSIATDARDTIESDTRSFLLWNEQVLNNRRQEILCRMRRAPWAMAGIATLILAICIGLSWLWSRAMITDRLGFLGPSMQIEGESYLLLPPETAELRQCTVMGQAMPCVRERRP